MIPNYFNYKVKIKDTPFETESGKKFEHTAAISFFDENRKESAYIELGFVDCQEIYKLIDQEKPINLDHCYVENFLSAFLNHDKNLFLSWSLFFPVF